VKRAAVECGFDPRFYSSHSLRKGGTSQMNANGLSGPLQDGKGVGVPGSRTRVGTYSLPLVSEL
jgi:hypothetical protein